MVILKAFVEQALGKYLDGKDITGMK